VSALALDRQAIEKKDFPISRRGYEPEAVDIHLEALAGELERMQRELADAQRGAGGPAEPPQAARTQSLALAASEQVRMIVEAAESSAADIERAAQEEAARIRADADAEARRTRDDAVARSQDHVGSVAEATSTMLQRVDAMEGELSALVDSLRTGTNRLTADLSLLQGNLGDLYGAAGSTQAPAPPRAEESPAPAPPEQPPSLAMPEPPPEEPDGDKGEEAGLFASTEPEAVPDATQAAEVARPRGGGDVEGARLIALNMALNGQTREETDAYLSENFELDDRGALLDEVYATVEG
jgi:F0F1-type ATP synthase membrane subunit b/b'